MSCCAKCKQTEATIHFCMTMDGAPDEQVDLCPACARSTGMLTVEPSELASHYLEGRKCELCGKDAVDGVLLAAGNDAAWCFDCGLEYSRIMAELLAQSPGLRQLDFKGGSFLSLLAEHPQFPAWSSQLAERALRIMRSRERGADAGRNN